MKTIIHVNQHKIRKNLKQSINEPVLTIKTYNSNQCGHTASIRDEEGQEVARIIYRPDKPLKCGARCWIETYLDVHVD
jgi:hypothetical protein